VAPGFGRPDSPRRRRVPHSSGRTRCSNTRLLRKTGRPGGHLLDNCGQPCRRAFARHTGAAARRRSHRPSISRDAFESARRIYILTTAPHLSSTPAPHSHSLTGVLCLCCRRHKARKAHATIRERAQTQPGTLRAFRANAKARTRTCARECRFRDATREDLGSGFAALGAGRSAMRMSLREGRGGLRIDRVRGCPMG